MTIMNGNIGIVHVAVGRQIVYSVYGVSGLSSSTFYMETNTDVLSTEESVSWFTLQLGLRVRVCQRAIANNIEQTGRAGPIRSY